MDQPWSASWTPSRYRSHQADQIDAYLTSHGILQYEFPVRSSLNRLYGYTVLTYVLAIQRIAG